MVHSVKNITGVLHLTANLTFLSFLQDVCVALNQVLFLFKVTEHERLRIIL